MKLCRATLCFWLRLLGLWAGFVLWPVTGGAELLKVGPGQRYSVPSAAIAEAKPGDEIEIASAEYHGDVAVIAKDGLRLRGTGGRPRLYAKGRHIEGKGLWVIRAHDIEIENIEFVGAKVPQGNGAGVRLESGSLVVRNCRFVANETGILTSNKGDVVLTVENSEFYANGGPSGQTHQLYAGAIASLEVTSSYFHQGLIGHLIKSRARRNLITYNKLTDEEGGRSSYELEFPNGGDVVVIGNVIQQSATTDNPKIISYGAEGYGKTGTNRLVLVHNTISDDRQPVGIPVDLRAGAVSVIALNNLLIEGGAWRWPADAIAQGNTNAAWGDVARALRQDYRPRRSASWLKQSVELTGTERIFRPSREPGLRGVIVPKDLHLVPGAIQQLVP